MEIIRETVKWDAVAQARHIISAGGSALPTFGCAETPYQPLRRNGVGFQKSGVAKKQVRPTRACNGRLRPELVRVCCASLAAGAADAQSLERQRIYDV